MCHVHVLDADLESWSCACVQVAALIHSLQLENNRATLLLSNLLDEEEGDDEALLRPATKVCPAAARGPKSLLTRGPKPWKLLGGFRGPTSPTEGLTP